MDFLGKLNVLIYAITRSFDSFLFLDVKRFYTFFILCLACIYTAQARSVWDYVSKAVDCHSLRDISRIKKKKALYIRCNFIYLQQSYLHHFTPIHLAIVEPRERGVTYYR